MSPAPPRLVAPSASADDVSDETARKVDAALAVMDANLHALEARTVGGSHVRDRHLPAAPR